MSNNYPVVGKTIYEIEKLLGQVLNVNPYARIVLVNGEEVTNDYIVGEDDVIEFVNEAYDKG
jgi:CRISPR/Cas system-associated protein endoribonuclease Cas2